MAQFDFAKLTPTTSKLEGKRGGGRKAGPNPFLDNDWVLQTYQSGEALAVDIPGGLESYTRKSRDGGEGGPGVKITGEARKAVTMIRAAADALEIGVRIETVPAKKANHVTIKFLGTKRRQSKKGMAE